MARIEKYTDTAVMNILRHMERSVANPSNQEIDPSRTPLNYALHNKIRNGRLFLSDFSYYRHRLKKLYVYGRKDVKTLCGWIITLPRDLPPEYQEPFFRESNAFLNEIYGKQNCISSYVHMDEAGQSHIHYTFVPVVPDKKRGGEKISAKELITRDHLRKFHPSLQKYLNEKGIPARLMNGATAAAGGNRTVRELKRERAEREHTREIERGVFLQ